MIVLINAKSYLQNKFSPHLAVFIRLKTPFFKFPIESFSKTRNYLLLISKPTINCLYYASINVAQPETASVLFSSVAQSCPTLCYPMNCSMSGLPVHHQLLEFTQTHVHRVGDAIQPSHPLSSPFPPAPNPSQHQSLFQ